MADELLTFKEMCGKFDVTPRTLRYYEYIELIQPNREGRSRYYTPRDCARMVLILRGRRFGFSLEEIRQWLLIYEEKGTSAQMQAWIELADRKLGELDGEKAQLQSTIDVLQKLRDDVKSNLS